MMRITEDYRRCALRAAKNLSSDASKGIAIPEMNGHFVIQKGRAPNPKLVQAVLRDENGAEYEVYTNSTSSS